jgi:hypothetical protein
MRANSGTIQETAGVRSYKKVCEFALSGFQNRPHFLVGERAIAGAVVIALKVGTYTFVFRSAALV